MYEAKCDAAERALLVSSAIITLIILSLRYMSLTFIMITGLMCISLKFLKRLEHLYE